MSEPLDSETGLPPGYPLREDWEITPLRLANELSTDPPPVLIDCRTPEERKIGFLAGSILIPMSEIASRVDDLKEMEGRRIVVYCHRGQRSLRVTAYLRHLGFADVWSLAGGIDAWSVSVDGEVPRY